MAFIHYSVNEKPGENVSVFQFSLDDLECVLKNVLRINNDKGKLEMASRCAHCILFSAT